MPLTHNTPKVPELVNLLAQSATQQSLQLTSHFLAPFFLQELDGDKRDDDDDEEEEEEDLSLLRMLIQLQVVPTIRHDGENIQELNTDLLLSIAQRLIFNWTVFLKRRMNQMKRVACDDPNKQTRNETSRGVSQQVRLGTILRVGKTRKPRKTKGDG